MVSTQITLLDEMNFQVLEIVGRQLQANIPKIPSDFVTCEISF